MGEERQEGHIFPLYLYEEVKGLGGLNLDRQFQINKVVGEICELIIF